MKIMSDRVSTNTGKASKADPVLHGAIAKAYGQMDEMEKVHQLTFEELMGYAERGEPIPLEKRALFAYQSSTVVRRLVDCVDDIMQLLGGRAIYMTSDIIQPWLDLNAGRAHVANNPYAYGKNFGGIQLGLENSDIFL